MTQLEILRQITAERTRQDTKFGPSPNHPDIRRQQTGVLDAAIAKAATDAAARDGTLTFEHILTEEVAEAYEAAHNLDTDALREELVQVAAVAVAWIEAIDARPKIVLDAAWFCALGRPAPTVPYTVRGRLDLYSMMHARACDPDKAANLFLSTEIFLAYEALAAAPGADRFDLFARLYWAQRTQNPEPRA